MRYTKSELAVLIDECRNARPPRLSSNARIIAKMVEETKYFPVRDLDAGRSKGHGKVKHWKKFDIDNGQSILLEMKS